MTSRINSTNMRSGLKMNKWHTDFRPMKRLDRVRWHQKWTLRKPKKISWSNTNAPSSRKYHRDPKTWSKTGRNLVFLLRSHTKTFSKKNKSSWRKKKHGGTTFWVRNKKKKRKWWRRLSWVPGVKISGKPAAKEVPARLDLEVVGSVATTEVLKEWLAHSARLVKSPMREFTLSKAIRAGKVKMLLRSSREISMNTIIIDFKKKRKFMIKWEDRIARSDRETQPLTEPSLEAKSLPVNRARWAAREDKKANTSTDHSNQRLVKNQRC